MPPPDWSSRSSARLTTARRSGRTRAARSNVTWMSEVADVDAAQRQAISLGGTLLHADPRGWRVLADPAGHPFCLVRASAMGH